MHTRALWHARVYARKHASKRTCIHAFTLACAMVISCACTHKYMQALSHAFMHAHLHITAHAHIHHRKQAHKYTHTHAHTHMSNRMYALSRVESAVTRTLALALKQRRKSAISIPGRQFVPYLSHPHSSDRRNSRIPVVNEFITVERTRGHNIHICAETYKMAQRLSERAVRAVHDYASEDAVHNCASEQAVHNCASEHVVQDCASEHAVHNCTNEHSQVLKRECRT